MAVGWVAEEVTAFSGILNSVDPVAVEPGGCGCRLLLLLDSLEPHGSKPLRRSNQGSPHADTCHGNSLRLSRVGMEFTMALFVC